MRFGEAGWREAAEAWTALAMTTSDSPVGRATREKYMARASLAQAQADKLAEPFGRWDGPFPMPRWTRHLTGG